MWATVSWQWPQSVPAPVAATISRWERPFAAAERRAWSDTARQEQTIIEASEEPIRRRLAATGVGQSDVENQYQQGGAAVFDRRQERLAFRSPRAKRVSGRKVTAGPLDRMA
jgi:hypothetical protein